MIVVMTVDFSDDINAQMSVFHAVTVYAKTAWQELRHMAIQTLQHFVLRLFDTIFQHNMRHQRTIGSLQLTRYRLFDRRVVPQTVRDIEQIDFFATRGLDVLRHSAVNKEFAVFVQLSEVLGPQPAVMQARLIQLGIIDIADGERIGLHPYLAALVITQFMAVFVKDTYGRTREGIAYAHGMAGVVFFKTG